MAEYLTNEYLEAKYKFQELTEEMTRQCNKWFEANKQKIEDKYDECPEYIGHWYINNNPQDIKMHIILEVWFGDGDDSYYRHIEVPMEEFLNIK